MITCNEAVSRLWDYVERSLSVEERQQIDEHIDICRQCCGEAEFAGQLRLFLGTHAAAGIPEEARGRLERFLDILDAEAGPATT